MRCLLALIVWMLAFPAFAAEQTLSLQVKGWHCGGCADKTVAAVKKLDGVKSVTADPKASTLTVVHDDAKVDRKRIEAAVASAGFKAQ